MLDRYEDILTEKEVAEILTYNTQTVKKLMLNGTLPYFTKGRRRYMYKDELIFMLIHS